MSSRRPISHPGGAPALTGQMSEDPPPFQVFLDENRDAVWRFLVSSVGPSDAEDCFQETFISALRAYPRLRADSNLQGVGADDRPPQGHGLPPRPRPPGAAGGRAGGARHRAPASGSDAADAELWGAVRELPPRQRSAVVLRFLRATLPTARSRPRSAARRTRRGARCTRVYRSSERRWSHEHPRPTTPIGRALRAGPGPAAGRSRRRGGRRRAAAAADRRRGARRRRLRGRSTRPSAPSTPPSPRVGSCAWPSPRSRSRRWWKSSPGASRRGSSAARGRWMSSSGSSTSTSPGAGASFSLQARLEADRTVRHARAHPHLRDPLRRRTRATGRSPPKPAAPAGPGRRATRWARTRSRS